MFFEEKNELSAEEIKKIYIDNLNYISQMDIKTYTLYRKWSQLNLQNSINFYKNNKSKIKEVKNNIWVPKDKNDYLDLNIKVIPVDTRERNLIWTILRSYCCSAFWNSSLGRNKRYYVVHETDDENADPFGFGIKAKKHEYLGVISLGSDFLSLPGRDNKIGWTNEQRKNGRINYTAMGSSIVPTQPLGYNYVGGKLIALLCASDAVVDFWDKSYSEPLLGITTTSLYGGFSQYNNLKYWKKCKSTEGNVIMEPSDDVYEQIRNWVTTNYKDEYYKSTRDSSKALAFQSHPKHKILNLVNKLLGGDIPDIKSKAPRGVYWCPLYQNTEEFLREEAEDPGPKRFDNKVESLVNLWKEKYASKRIDKFTNDDIADILFMDDLINSNWEYVKEKYL